MRVFIYNLQKTEMIENYYFKMVSAFSLFKHAYVQKWTNLNPCHGMAWLCCHFDVKKRHKHGKLACISNAVFPNWLPTTYDHMTDQSHFPELCFTEVK